MNSNDKVTELKKIGITVYVKYNWSSEQFAVVLDLLVGIRPLPLVSGSEFSKIVRSDTGETPHIALDKIWDRLTQLEPNEVICVHDASHSYKMYARIDDQWQFTETGYPCGYG